MTPVFAKKAAVLQKLLEDNGLLSKKASQAISHPDLIKGQNGIGKEQTKEHNESIQGIVASDAKQVPAPQEEPRRIAEGIEEDPNKPAEAALASSGTAVTTPAAEESKTKLAGLRTKLAAATAAALKAQEVAVVKQAAVAAPVVITTATEVMSKIAALQLAPKSEALMHEIEADFAKLASTNPLFAIACERAAIRKQAEEIDALAASENIPPEVAAQALDGAMAGDPAAQAEFDNEVQGEAVSDLAGAEQDVGQLMAELDTKAAEISEATGETVTAEDLVAAVDEVVSKAEELGVAPEELVMAAAKEMQAGAPAASPEDEATAKGILDEAATNGISPEEVIAGITQGEAAGGEQAAPAPEASEADVQKVACLTHLAQTRRGANLHRIIAGK